MRRDADIVVVGAGITGVATARALAGYPGSVVVLEQFDVGHARGSSHGTSRIFRLNYADERFVRMAMASDVAWRELEAERGERLVERVGCLDLGPVAADTARALAACGASYETLAAEDVAERWPIAVEQGETGVFQPDGGVLYADRAYAALLGEAVERGVEVRAATAVRALASDRGSVVLSHDRGELRARAVVVTAGAWAAGLVEGTASSSRSCRRVRRSSTSTFRARSASARDRLRQCAREGRRGIARVGQAAYSLAAPGRGLKAGLHHSGPATDPDADPDPDGRVAAWAAQWARSPVSRCGRDARQRDVPLHEHGRRAVRARAAGSRGRRLGLLGAWVQVRADRRPDARCARARRRRLNSEQLPCTIRTMGRVSAIVGVVVCVVACAACTGGGDPASSGSTSGADDAARTIAVYLARDGKVAPVRRVIHAPQEEAVSSALDALTRARPTAEERSAGYVNAVPLRHGDVEVAGGVARVVTEAGPLSRLAQAQVVYTLTDLPGVERVADSSSDGREGRPVDRPRLRGRDAADPRPIAASG